ncbi:glycosyltransferase [Flavobacteriaceae bacterium]|nr:glycosyltransferase [Flavobacteriaceae bacterium]
MILIDAIHIHSHGGLTILDSFINGIEENPSVDINNFHFFIDDRIDLSMINRIKNYSIERVRANHFNRKKAYEKKINLVNKIVCLSNIPPPIKSSKSVYIYFHNLLLLDNKTTYVTPYFFILNKLKLQYIKFFNHKSYRWIVQTNFMKNKLSEILKIDKESINVYPFYSDQDIYFKEKDFNSKSINFLCVTSKSKHKNLNNLIKSFLNARLDVKKQFSLFITIEGNDITKGNKNIIYLGYIKRDEVISHYLKSHFVVLPSLIESFGLPIIEGIKCGSNILVSNIDSLKEICIPSISFNPTITKDIVTAIEMAGSLSYQQDSILTIKNEINNFIKLINHDV